MMEGVGFLIKRGNVGQQNSCKLRIKAPCLKCFFAFDSCLANSTLTETGAVSVPLLSPCR